MKRIFKRSLAAILAASMFMSSSGMVSLGASISDASQTESVGGNYTQVDNVSTLSVEASTADETSGNSWGGGKMRFLSPIPRKALGTEMPALRI